MKQKIDGSSVPRHIAVIMDGNGRWARQRDLPRLEGHRASRASIRATVKGCDELGVRFLTLYTFSAENWSRPEAEVRALMALIEHALREESTDLHGRNVRVRLLGDRGPLPQSLKDEIDRVEGLTGGNAGLTLQLAINYGGRQEILQAAFALAREAAAGAVSVEELEESHFTRHLYRPDAPDPDLLIRTGGDLRVSNYLLWEIAYTEIYLTPVLWPDFRRAHLYEAVADYQGRERRFGGVKNAV
ncbi:MAG: polyprenyl diphosphate synthase [Armatimonadota bacterium]|nr:polyprenyl diphosphate synthase [Armatimonadota bacterium]